MFCLSVHLSFDIITFVSYFLFYFMCYLSLVFSFTSTCVITSVFCNNPVSSYIYTGLLIRSSTVIINSFTFLFVSFKSICVPSYSDRCTGLGVSIFPNDIWHVEVESLECCKNRHFDT